MKFIFKPMELNMRLFLLSLITVLLFFSSAQAKNAKGIEVLNVREETGTSEYANSQNTGTTRFIDNGEGTVLDKNTGLIWLQDANVNGARMPIQAARLYIENMNSGKLKNLGFTNWRLPSISELEMLSDKSRFYPALPPGHGFVNVQNDFYWSSSGSADIVEDIWILDMASGNKVPETVSDCNFRFLWPVRSSMDQETKSGTVMSGGLNEHGQLGDGTTDTERDSFERVIGLSDVVKVVSGSEHSAAIKSDGAVWTWGRNAEGQLGDGTVEDRNIPIMVKGLWNIVDIAAGISHTVALRSDGTVWAWGRNYYGQLGDGTTEERHTPVQVKILTDVVRIFAGQYHTFALKSDGTVWAWGWNNNGQLGDGTTIDSRTPVHIERLSNVTTISAGIHHSVALKSDGTVWAWGWNDYGLLGNDNKDDGRSPAQVKGLSGIVDIATGMYHTAALKSDGTVWTWGKNEYGQLGSSATKASTALMVEGINGIKQIAAGMYHTVALKSDGTIWVWGQDLKNKKEKSSPVQKRNIKGNFIALSAGKYFTLVLSGAETQK